MGSVGSIVVADGARGPPRIAKRGWRSLLRRSGLFLRRLAPAFAPLAHAQGGSLLRQSDVILGEGGLGGLGRGQVIELGELELALDRVVAREPVGEAGQPPGEALGLP